MRLAYRPLVPSAVLQAQRLWLPNATATGHLPPGVHLTDFATLAERFGTNAHRLDQLETLRETLIHYQLAGVEKVFVVGSFVSTKPHPRDIDLAIQASPDIRAAYATAASNVAWSRELHTYAAEKPVTNIATLQIGDNVRAKWLASPPTFVEFFSHTRTGQRIGVVALELSLPISF